ncbi:MAG: hypothetical protein F4148_13255 [Caldilineaceae bacterium SB0675_bin_29]|uniref:Uncharacterized protein n=1 Tax=Caldilineaceae bacterium SB0675_bin_29 TaxID=2605266 RepID=A0A6B1G166_9CHLR|nr:hypothetical protein [Caldilineaceae bacterium SB0675_bin_29]
MGIEQLLPREDASYIADIFTILVGLYVLSQPLVWFLKNYSMPWQAWVLIFQNSVVIFLVYIYSEVFWLSSLVSFAMIATLHLTKSAFHKKA